MPYRLMIHRKTISGLDVDLFTHIYVGRIYDMVNDFKTHRFALEFDSLFLILIAK